MAGVLCGGQRKWTCSVDDDGYREYKITFLVLTTTRLDGPYTILQTPGLPITGAQWAFDNDLDPWVWCRPERSVKQLGRENEGNIFWEVDVTFSNKKFKYCKDTQFDNPLLEPQKISGDSNRWTVEATTDFRGNKLSYSSLEQIRGKLVEFDANRPTVRIEQNVLDLELDLCANMINTVNHDPMWGLKERCVKMGGFKWERKYLGSCGIYFTRIFDFEIDRDSWDREVADEGTKVLLGKWHPTKDTWIVKRINGAMPNRFNPSHFTNYPDRKNNHIRGALNGAGLPAGVCIELEPEIANTPAGLTVTLQPPTNTLNYYVSIAGSNTGNFLLDQSWWAELRGNIVPQPWNNTLIYVAGNLVTHNGSIYLARSLNAHDEPPSGSWIQLNLGLNFKNVYNEATTYAIGDYVSESTGTAVGTSTSSAVVPCDKTLQGKILVQYYPESNFFQLGIPTGLNF